MKTKFDSSKLPAEVQAALRAAVASFGIRNARTMISIAWGQGYPSELRDHSSALQRWRNSPNGHGELAKVRMADFKASAPSDFPITLTGDPGHTEKQRATVARLLSRELRNAQDNPEQEQQTGEDLPATDTPVCKCCGGDRDADTSDPMQPGDTLCCSCDAEERDSQADPATYAPDFDKLLTLPILDEVCAAQLFHALASAGLTHNPDNDPAESLKADGSPMFTPEQAQALRARLTEAEDVMGSHDELMALACEVYGV